MSGRHLLRLQVIDELSDLVDIRTEWSALESRIPRLTPFQTPEWLLTWWKHFGSGTLQVFVLRDGDGTLVGIVPAFRHEWQDRSQITLLGAGVSDYLEPALAPEFRGEAVSCVRGYLEDNRSWEVCNWQDLSDDTPWKQLVDAAGLSVAAEPDTPCSEIRLDSTFEHYWEARPHGLKRNVRRYREKAAQVSELHFVSLASFDSECFDALVRLHTLRWREQGEPGMIRANRSSAFLRDVAASFSARRMLRLFALRFEGVIAAVILGFAYRNVLYAYLSAFDPAYGALGFGRTLLFESLRHAFEQNYSAWNFLRGTEPYKADWGAETIQKLRLVVTRQEIARR